MRARWGEAAGARAGPAGVVVLVLLTGCGGGPIALDRAVEQTVAAGPGRHSAGYRTPDPLLAHELGGAVLALLSGVDDVPLPDGARQDEGVDGAGDPVAMVTEDADGGPPTGWGLYAVRPGSGTPPRLVIQVPHPRADRWTEVLGPELFTALDAQVLLVAGAHRTAANGAADVAHEPASAFAAVDRAVVGPGTVVLQVHGFDESRHPGDAEIVLSSSEETSGDLGEDLDEAFEDAGFQTCVYDGDRCAALAGTTNVQAAHARAVGADFIHLELAADLREDGPRRLRVIDVLADVLGS
jgi:hypothetical protein